MKCSFHLLIMVLALSLNASAQSGLSSSVLASSGSSSQSGKVHLEWTLGEVAVATVSTHSGFLTEGFHQPEILRVESVQPNLPDASETFASEAIIIAPNPVSTLLTIQIPENWSRSASTIVLFDANGQQIKTAQITPGVATSELDLAAHPAGTYWLHIVAKDSKQAQTFKVIKIQ
ncbi:MAG: T9SS type A sorting domain-containing protein [Saprospiraceae bacterium]